MDERPEADDLEELIQNVSLIPEGEVASLKRALLESFNSELIMEQGSGVGEMLHLSWQIASTLDWKYTRYLAAYTVYVIMTVLSYEPAIAARCTASLADLENSLRRNIVVRDQSPILWPWSLPSDVLPKVLTVAKFIAEETPEDQALMDLALDPDTPEPLLEQLALHHDLRVRQSAAENPNLPVSSLLALLADREASVRTQASKHPEVPQETLELLRAAGSTNDLSGFRFPSNAVSPEELRSLVDLGYWGRILAAWHPKTPARVLNWQAHLGCLDARTLVAANPSTPSHVLTRLAADSFRNVRRVVAQNPFLPAKELELLIALGATPDLEGFGEPSLRIRPLEMLLLMQVAGFGPWLHTLIARHPNANAEVLNQVPTTRTETAKLLLQHPETPKERLPEIVKYLALNCEPDVRREAAAHPAMPTDLLEKLVRAGSSPDLTSFASWDPSMTPEELESLVYPLRGLSDPAYDDDTWWARVLVARHPNTSRLLLRDLIADDTDGFHVMVDPAWGEMWDETTPRLLVASNPSADEDMLRDLASINVTSLRIAVAKSPNAPKDVLQELALDINPAVRSAAAAPR